jgi:hypothetical protein
MAGGHKEFGPTYNTTTWVRLGIEGDLNGNHPVDVTEAQNVDGELAGKFAAIGANGVKLGTDGGTDVVGLYREDLGDMMSASEKATFYFRGGEYYVSEHRLGTALADFSEGDEITSNANGEIIPVGQSAAATPKVLGTVVHAGEYDSGNMYEHVAPGNLEGGSYLGFIMHV